MNIYISGLSYGTTDADLNELFSEYGEISSAKIFLGKRKREEKIKNKSTNLQNLYKNNFNFRFIEQNSYQKCYINWIYNRYSTFTFFAYNL